MLLKLGFNLNFAKVSFQIKSEAVSDLEWSIQAVGTPQWHQYCSSHHHTQCPTHCLYRSPLCPHLEHYLQLTAVDQLSMELQQIYIIDAWLLQHVLPEYFRLQKILPSHPTPASAE